MIEACRIVENQSRLYAVQATTTFEKAQYIESVLELTKPKLPAVGWHPLIATPFRYPLPVPPLYAARYRPPYFHKNVLYASRDLRTIFYEHAFHYLKERVHLKAIPETGRRTAFTLFITSTDLRNLHGETNLKALMDRNDYGPSHAYVHTHPYADVLVYPSCRDPQQSDNFAVFDIHALAPHIGTEQSQAFYFDPPSQSILWMDAHLRIQWKDVS